MDEVFLLQRSAKPVISRGGRWPDLSVLLDLPLEVAEARRSAQRAHLPGFNPDRIEAEDRQFHEKVAQGFRSLAADDEEHWVVIDGIAVRGPSSPEKCSH